MRVDVETIVEVLRSAQQALVDAGVPEPLQPAAFERTVDALLAEVRLGDVATRPALEGRGVASRSSETLELESDPLARIAERAGCTVEEIRSVYRFEASQLRAVVPARRIAAQDAAGSRELTLLVAGGRQAAGLEEWTALAHARAVCLDYSRLDSANYATSILAMDDEFSFSGKRASREVRLTMPGWDAWSQLVERLVKGD